MRYTLFTLRPANAAPLVKKPRKPMIIAANTEHRAYRGDDARAGGSMDRRIRAFLAGETDGADVLDALYGAAMDEPVPQRLLDLLKR